MINFLNKIVPFEIKKYVKSVILINKNERVNRNRRELFYSQFVNKGDLIFDVGANIGNRTHAFLKLGAKVIAIEPQKKCRNVLKLRFGNKITLIEKGLGAKEELKSFYISNNHTLSTFSDKWVDNMKKSGRFSNSNWDKIEQTQITTLDKIIDDYGTPKFIKVDVEGFEYEVFSGLSRIIDFISFEFAVPENLVALNKCLESLYGIDQNYFYNYSIGESMELVLEEWYNYTKMKDLVNSDEFINSSVGDIYVKRIQ